MNLRNAIYQMRRTYLTTSESFISYKNVLHVPTYEVSLDFVQVVDSRDEAYLKNKVCLVIPKLNFLELISETLDNVYLGARNVYFLE